MIDLLEPRVLPMQLLLPLIGGAVLAVLRCRPVLARRIALLNVLGSLILGGISFALARQTLLDIDPAAGLNIVLGWGLSWNPIPSAAPITLEFGIDGINIYPVLLVPAVVWGLLFNEWHRVEGDQLVLLLVAESVLLAHLTAQDAVSYVGLLLLTAVIVPLSGMLDGAPGCRAQARRIMAMQLSAAFLVLIGLAGAIAGRALMLGAPHSTPSQPESSLPQLITGVRELVAISPPAELLWRQLSVWPFLMLSGGFTVWAAVVPLHLTNLNALRGLSPIGRVLLGAVSLKFGILGWLKIVVPLFPELCTAIGPVFLLGCLIGVLYLALRLKSETDAVTMGAITALLGSVLALAGVLTLSRIGLRGAALHVIGHMPAVAMLLLASPAETPTSTALRRCAALATAGLPGLSVFPGVLLIVIGCLGGSLWPAVGWPLPVVIICAAAGLSGAAALPRADPGSAQWDWRLAAAVGPLGLAVVWIGVYPQSALELVGPTLDQLISN